MNIEQFRASIDDLLLADLENYQPAGTTDLQLDWSTSEGENHVLENVEGTNILDSWSSINILDNAGKPVGSGWCDFVVEVETGKLHLFWYSLDIETWGNKPATEDETKGFIPPHIWALLSEKTKLLVGQLGGKYEWRLKSSERMPAILHF